MKRVFANELEKMGVDVYGTRDVVIEEDVADEQIFTMYSDCGFDDTCGCEEALEKLMGVLEKFLSVCPELDGDVLRKTMKSMVEDEECEWWAGKRVGNIELSFELCDDMDDAVLIRVALEDEEGLREVPDAKKLKPFWKSTGMLAQWKL